MLRGVARTLYESLENGRIREPDWFDAALATAAARGIGVDLVIWEAVREIVEEARQAEGRDSETAKR